VTHDCIPDATDRIPDPKSRPGDRADALQPVRGRRRAGTQNTLLLTPEFFTEVKDGTVDLTFHFWSGARTSYRITKTGSTVTGTPIRKFLYSRRNI
jgi:hypothetical protein